MVLEFKTKTDINGNTYHLIIDTEKKTLTYSGFGGIVITRKEMREIIEKASAEGYTDRIQIM